MFSTNALVVCTALGSHECGKAAAVGLFVVGPKLINICAYNFDAGRIP